MQIKSEKLQKNQTELVIEVSAEEIKPNLEAAARRLSRQVKFEGFRPGKAPYDVVRARLGEMAIMEEALEDIIQKTYAEAVKRENLLTVGQPRIDIEKIAPGNPIVYKATVSLLPKMRLVNFRKIEVQRKGIKVADEKVDKTLEELRKMQTKEVLADKPATRTDKVVVDMDMFLDKVPVDGGQAKDHHIFLSEKYYIPGLQDKLVGVRKGEERSFALPFPGEHYNKALAGKNVDFKVKIKDVFEVQLPEVNDDFAAHLGFKSVDDLKKQIRENIKKEAEYQEEQRLEGEIVDEIIKKSEFEAIPDLLIEGEIEKMVHELEHSISAQGLKFEDYLKHIKKSKEDLRKEFVDQAERRVKGALIMRELAEEQSVEITNEEIEKEAEKLAEMYKNDPKTQEQIRSEGYREYLRNVLVNRKVIEYLKKQCLEK